MFLILYYDVGEKRCTKMLKICRKYLEWVQNSVFEGKISDAGFEKMIFELKKTMNIDEGDSLVIYKFRQMKYYERKVYGADKKGDLNFI
ncbi:MAG: CRISPR-associated endonuclease Cas2 [Candidatus Cloacimonetes bacterium]|nr:CRISPR-associated endonuclease Cas2 [Candidatus Cloacimonadota bacterium]